MSCIRGFALSLSALFLLFATDCGGGGRGGFRPEDSFREATSLGDMVYDFALCFSERNYDRFAELVHEGFIFIFAPDDSISYPGTIPPDGLWGYAEFMTAVSHMLNPDFIPCDPSDKVKEIKMTLSLSGDSSLVSDEEAPPRTLKQVVALTLDVDTAGGALYHVESRPTFFFSPDSSKTPPVWRLWRIEDAASELWSGTLGGGTGVWDGRQSASAGALPARVAGGRGAAAVKRPSLGLVLSVYGVDCKK